MAGAAAEPLCPPGSLQEERGYKLSVQESVTVQEGLCVLVPCSFSYPWSSWSYAPALYWYRNGDNAQRDDPVATNNPHKRVKTETQGRFHLHEYPRTNCSLSIRDARKSDTGLYSFRVERGPVGYTYRDKKLNLQVTGTSWDQEWMWDPGLWTGTGHWNSPCPGLGTGVVKREPSTLGEVGP